MARASSATGTRRNTRTIRCSNISRPRPNEGPVATRTPTSPRRCLTRSTSTGAVLVDLVRHLRGLVGVRVATGPSFGLGLEIFEQRIVLVFLLVPVALEALAIGARLRFAASDLIRMGDAAKLLARRQRVVAFGKIGGQVH